MLETKSIAALAFNETPRKRKRETGFVSQPLKNEDAAAADAAAAVGVTASCFTNAAFSSTPKKLIGRRRLAKGSENTNPFAGHPGLEIKSIADLATVHKHQQQQQQKQSTTNPFEVVRHPSKKKKKSEHACFENPGLNLELPERQFNPYEVVRCVATPTKCFVNAALNLRGSDAPASLNPFEIHRRSEISAAASNPGGVANPALTEEPLPTSLKIGLPFAPTLGCRIDFHGMELANLTPSKLFAEKLVFSPVAALKKEEAEGKRSLGAISEEESTLDIGKELDRYQLELENSINEAKLRKKGIIEEVKQVEQVQLVEQLDRRIICTTRRRTLTEITEEITEEATPMVKEETAQPTVEALPVPDEILEGGDVAYASESEPEELEDELDFKAPARFVRAYRPAAPVAPIKASSIAGSKESLQSIASSKSAKSADAVRGSSVRNMLRKSIRKLMHPMKEDKEKAEKEPEQEQENHHHVNIISSIRHSLRRRPRKKEQELELESKTMQRPADISIVDSSERTMKLRSNVPQTEYMRIEQLTNERKHTLRNSIRRSTRDVLRHVFHKSQDAYATAK
ncbi:hypothetical protein ACLKA7_006925 [Drosophila subpalustris]